MKVVKIKKIDVSSNDIVQKIDRYYGQIIRMKEFTHDVEKFLKTADDSDKKRIGQEIHALASECFVLARYLDRVEQVAKK